MRNFIPPEPDERARAWQRLQDKVAIQINDAKEKWMRGIMKRILPASIFNMAYSKNHGQQKRVAAYLFENRIEVQQHPDKTVLVRYTNPDNDAPMIRDMEFQVLGEFKLEWKDQKLNILCRNSKNLPKLPEP